MPKTSKSPFSIASLWPIVEVFHDMNTRFAMSSAVIWGDARVVRPTGPNIAMFSPMMPIVTSPCCVP